MKPTRLDVLFTPAEFAALTGRDLTETVCVVFDILRATSTMITALANGAEAILPVGEIGEALAIRAARPQVLLAGERNGLRILAGQTGGTDFDLGNSPREFLRETVQGKTIVMTTTNGTRALQACASARLTLIGSFLGLEALGRWIMREKPGDLLLVCSGTVDQAAYEDVLGAGALCDRVWPEYLAGSISDSCQIARQIFNLARPDLLRAVQHGRNGRRLLANPELAEDVACCLKRDSVDFLAAMGKDGAVRRLD